MSWTTAISPAPIARDAPRRAAISSLVNFLSDRIWALETYALVSGASVTFYCVFNDAVSLANVSAKVYNKKSDVSATIFPAGVISVNGNVVTLKPMTALKGGNRYVVAVTAQVDGGDTRVRKFMVICLRAGDLL